jgi:hypothetical protein
MRRRRMKKIVKLAVTGLILSLLLWCASPVVAATTVSVILPEYIYATRTFLLEGTAEDPQGIVRVIVLLDGKNILEKEVPGITKVNLKDLNLTVKILDPGKHILDLLVYSHYGESGNVSVHQSYRLKVETADGKVPKIYCDKPHKMLNDEPYVLHGRIIDDTGIVRVQTFVDGRISDDKAVGGLRELKLEDIDLSIAALLPGKHRMMIKAFDRYGDSYHFSEIEMPFTVENRYGAKPTVHIWPIRKDYIPNQPYVISGYAFDDTGIQRVEVFENGQRIFIKNYSNAKYVNFEIENITCDFREPCNHWINAIVYDNANRPGLQYTMQCSRFVVHRPPWGKLPVVKLQAPENAVAGQRFKLAGTLRDDSGVTKLIAFLDGLKVAEKDLPGIKEASLEDLDIFIPLRLKDWGVHKLVVRAYDYRQGKVEHYVDSTINIIAASSAADAPTLQLFPPKYVTAQKPFTIAGRAWDDTGITKVVLYLDHKAIYSRDLEKPTKVLLEDLSIMPVTIHEPGTHVLCLRAYDAETTDYSRYTQQNIAFDVAKYHGEAPGITIREMGTIKINEACNLSGSVTDDTGVTILEIYQDGSSIYKHRYENPVREISIDALALPIKVTETGDHKIMVRALDTVPPLYHFTEKYMYFTAHKGLGRLPDVEAEFPTLIPVGLEYKVKGTASDDSGLRRVAVYLDTKLVKSAPCKGENEVNLADFDFTFKFVKKGVHRLTVRAYDEEAVDSQRFTDREFTVTVKEIGAAR